MNGFRRVAALAVSLLVVAGAVGCGGDDSTEAESLTKEEWIAQADQICGDADADINTAAEDAGIDGTSSEEELTAFLTDEVLPSNREQVDEIDALGAPEGDEDQVDELLTTLNEAISAAEDDPSLLVTGGGEQFDDVNRLAQDYGLQVCGQN